MKLDKQRTELQMLNTTRWQQCGQLLRTAALLESMAHSSPYGKYINQPKILNAIISLRSSAELVRYEYIRAKREIISKRLDKV